MKHIIITTIADDILRVGAGILALLLMILMIVLVFWIPFKAIQRDLKRGPKAFIHTGTFTYIVMFVGMGGFFAIGHFWKREICVNSLN
jgi:hypothetical protein